MSELHAQAFDSINKNNMFQNEDYRYFSTEESSFTQFTPHVTAKQSLYYQNKIKHFLQ
jgi:hypothetical protein